MRFLRWQRIFWIFGCQLHEERGMQTSKILSLVVLISLSLCFPRSLCTAQKKIPPADHDYYVLAIRSEKFHIGFRRSEMSFLRRLWLFLRTKTGSRRSWKYSRKVFIDALARCAQNFHQLPFSYRHSANDGFTTQISGLTVMRLRSVSSITLLVVSSYVVANILFARTL